MDPQISPPPLDKIARYVDDFLAYARSHPNDRFQVTAFGCGIAGFSHAEIAALFSAAPENCIFEEAWRPFLGSSKNYWGTYQPFPRMTCG